MSGAVLDTRTLNRALLARQLLLERSRSPLTRAVERVGGLQSQYAPSAYIGLWSRLEKFDRPQLTRALEKGQLIQGTLMRATIHVVSARDYPLLTEAVRRSRGEWWNRVAKDRRIDPKQSARLVSLVREALAEGPVRREGLVQTLVDHGHSKGLWEGVGLLVDMIRLPPSGTWERRRADIYGLAEDRVDMTPVGEDNALEHLVSRYLGGFGPATIDDISTWGGVSITTLRPIVERMRLRTFRDLEGGELLDLPRQPIPAPETPAPVRFLPTWDATLLAHARRTQILPEEYRSIIFHTKNPHSVPTFLVDGAVAGTWRQEGPGVRVEPFVSLPRPIRRELDMEADRLAMFLA